MSEEIVRILTVQTGNSTQTINNLKQAIKSLRQELSKAQVGSRQYNETLRELTQVQRQYSLINKDISERSKAQEVNLRSMAQLGQNLAKTYSSINAVIGLLGDNNEDLNKSMLKVQRTIQLIQGLSGIGGLIKQIPQLLNGFKSWLSSFDPLERKVANIAKGINAIDGKKLGQIAKLQGGSVKIGDVSAKATAGGLGSGTINFDADRKAYEGQAASIAAINRLREAEILNLESLKTQRDVEIKKISELEKTYTSLSDALTQAGARQSDIQGNIDRLTKSTSDLEKGANSLAKTVGYTSESTQKLNNAIKGESLEWSRTTLQMQEYEKQLNTVNSEIGQHKTNLSEVNKQIDESKANVENFNKEIAKIGKTTDAVSKAGNFFKSVFSAAVFSAAVAGVIALVTWIAKLASKAYEAAREQRAFNKAIREGTAQGSAKAIVILKELSIAYQKVGDSAKAKEQFLVDYNDKIKETGIAVNDVNTADDVFIKNTAKYVDALRIRAAAQATENVAIKEYEQYLIERDKLLEKRATAPTSYNPNPVGGGSFSPYNTNTFLAQTVDDIDKALADLDKKAADRLTARYADIFNLKASIAGIFDTGSGSGSGSGSGGGDTSPKENPFAIDEQFYKQYLEDINKYQESLKSAKDKEIDEINNFYNRLIAGEMLFGDDYQKYVEAREKAVADIEKKYADEELENQKKQAEDRLAQLDDEIERIRKRSQIKELQLKNPAEEQYRTAYKQQPATFALGLGWNWTNSYQSGSNVKDQYNAEVAYNNGLLELTRERLNNEKVQLDEELALVKQKAEGNVELQQWAADRELEIQAQLAENKKALDDAELANQIANTEAMQKLQAKRQEALNATLSVASNVMGGLASLYKANSERAKKDGESEAKYQKEKEKAFNAYKKLSIAQAIIDTYKSANEAYTAVAGIPYVGPYLAPVAAAAAIIAGIANVRRIQNEEMSTSSSSSSVAVTAPAMQTNPIEYQRQLLGDQELDEMNKPMKCYVLESEITSTQNKVKVSESNSSF